MSQMLLRLDRCVPLRRRVRRGLAKDPVLFSRLLSAQVQVWGGDLSPHKSLFFESQEKRKDELWKWFKPA